MPLPLRCVDIITFVREIKLVFSHRLKLKVKELTSCMQEKKWLLFYPYYFQCLWHQDALQMMQR